MITRGILNSSLVHRREVFYAAIVASAAAVVLSHNHPPGNPTPSSDDRLVTEQLVAAGRLLDIPIHDHVIVGCGRYVSFAEAGRSRASPAIARGETGKRPSVRCTGAHAARGIKS